MVAKEFNNGEVEGLFAATPPLEAMRLLLSEAATMYGQSHREDKVIMINDVSRAFFEAPAKRDICVELREEALTDEERQNAWSNPEQNCGVVGKLEMSLYGTRDAAFNFQEEVAKFMKRI